MSVTQAPPPAATAPAEQPADRLSQLEAHVKDLDRRVEEIRLRRDSWTLIIFAVAVVALLAGIIAVGFGMRAVDEAERHVEASMAPLAALFAASRTKPPVDIAGAGFTPRRESGKEQADASACDL